MANSNTAGYGCRAVMTVGSTPATSGQSEYKLHDYDGAAFNTIFKGDPVQLNVGTQAAEKGYLMDSTYDTMDDGKPGGADWANNTASSTLLVGVFNGGFYVDSGTKKPTWANSIASGSNFGVDYNTGSSDGTAFVMDNPLQEFNIRVGGTAWQQNDVGLFYNTGDNGATGRDGMSDERLVIANTSANAMFTLVRGANVSGQNDYTADGSDVVVVINPASHAYN
jgi:hypothetical protein